MIGVIIGNTKQEEIFQKKHMFVLVVEKKRVILLAVML